MIFYNNVYFLKTLHILNIINIECLLGEYIILSLVYKIDLLIIFYYNIFYFNLDLFLFLLLIIFLINLIYFFIMKKLIKLY